jgi:hypothetical protein
MIRRRARAAGIKTEIGCHTFRATGITAYLKNGGRLEGRAHRDLKHPYRSFAQVISILTDGILAIEMLLFR